ncbi:DUF6053 domain-containing protein [Lysobacter yananisis]|uniref:DUF6053 domain-containing protein n=1 Tax=Lysobacter yananisis TaxID=1003114 RepID=UPI003CE59B2A
MGGASAPMPFDPVAMRVPAIGAESVGAEAPPTTARRCGASTLSLLWEGLKPRRFRCRPPENSSPDRKASGLKPLPRRPCRRRALLQQRGRHGRAQRLVVIARRRLLRAAAS